VERPLDAPLAVEEEKVVVVVFLLVMLTSTTSQVRSPFSLMGL
jgi:hypothetical protein